MFSIFTALKRSFAMFAVPGVKPRIIASVLLSLVLLAAWIALAAWFFGSTTFFENTSWETGADVVGTGLAAVMGWFLFPILTPLIAGFFVEQIAHRIEAFEYNVVETQNPDGVFTTLWADVKFALLALLLNLICLPLYLVPLVNVILFYSLNGYLLGREFFVMAAERHGGRKAAEALRKKYYGTIWLAGAAIAFIATLPLINLLTPFIAISMMVHLHQALRD